MAKREQAAKPTLLEQASVVPVVAGCWMDKLPEPQRTEVIELLQAKIDGKLAIGRLAIVELLKRNGIETSETSLRRAMSKLQRS